MNNSRKIDFCLTSIFITILYSILIFVSIKYHDGAHINILLLFGVMGAALGWAFGIWMSPYNKQEQTELTQVAKLVGTFISGYAISKFDKMISALVDKSSDLIIGIPPKQAVQANSAVPVVIIIFFITSFVLAMIFTYVIRRYWYPELTEKTGQ